MDRDRQRQVRTFDMCIHYVRERTPWSLLKYFVRILVRVWPTPKCIGPALSRLDLYGREFDNLAHCEVREPCVPTLPPSLTLPEAPGPRQHDRRSQEGNREFSFLTRFRPF